MSCNNIHVQWGDNLPLSLSENLSCLFSRPNPFVLSPSFLSLFLPARVRRLPAVAAAEAARHALPGARSRPRPAAQLPQRVVQGVLDAALQLHLQGTPSPRQEGVYGQRDHHPRAGGTRALRRSVPPFSSVSKKKREIKNKVKARRFPSVVLTAGPVTALHPRAFSIILCFPEPPLTFLIDLYQAFQRVHARSYSATAMHGISIIRG